MNSLLLSGSREVIVEWIETEELPQGLGLGVYPRRMKMDSKKKRGFKEYLRENQRTVQRPPLVRSFDLLVFRGTSLKPRPRQTPAWSAFTSRAMREEGEL
jgi:hypothetical protein